MKIIVPTCDRYLPITKGYAELFNKYWSPEQEVYLICDEKPDFDLPDNFKIVSIPLGQRRKSAWTNYLLEFFKIVDWKDDDCFLMAMDDHYLTKPVNIDLINKAENEIKNNGIHKVWACPPKNIFGRYKDYNEDFNEWDSSARVARNNIIAWCDPSIWQVGLYRKFLTADLKPEDQDGVIVRDFQASTGVYPYRVLYAKEGLYHHADCMRNHIGFNTKFPYDPSPPKSEDLPIFQRAWDDLKEWKYY